MLTITLLNEVPGLDGEPQFVVAIRDEELPGVEGVFSLREGDQWAGTRSLEVRSFAVQALGDTGQRINAVLVRNIPFGRWMATAVTAASDLRDGRDTTVWTSPAPRPLAKRRNDVRGAPDYEAVARIYRVTLRHGGGGTAREVADVFGISDDLAAHWIARARYMGLLGPAPQRQATAGVQDLRKRDAREHRRPRGEAGR